MRSCEITGGNAFYAAGVYVHGDYSVGEFYNVSFTDLSAAMSTALYAQGSTSEESGILIKFAGCQFLRNLAVAANIVTIGWDFVRAEISDCFFANNDGCTLSLWFATDSQIARCVFRENTGSPNSWPGYGSAVVIHPLGSKVVSITDSRFERNTGDAKLSGGALTLSQGGVLMNNVSFLANTALGFDGGAPFEVRAGAKVIATNCFALANVGNQFGAGFFVSSGELTIINSTCQSYTQDLHAGVKNRDLSHFCLLSAKNM